MRQAPMAQTPSQSARISSHGGIADGTALQHRVRHRRRGYKRSICTSSLRLRGCRSRQRNNEFGKRAWARIHFDLSAMFFPHDVMAHRPAKPGSFASRLSGEERIEHLLFHLQRDSSAVIANPDFDRVAQAFGGCAQRRLEALVASFLALSRGVKAV